MLKKFLKMFDSNEQAPIAPQGVSVTGAYLRLKHVNQDEIEIKILTEEDMFDLIDEEGVYPNADKDATEIYRIGKRVINWAGIDN